MDANCSYTITSSILSLTNDIKNYGIALRIDSDIYKQHRISEMPSFDLKVPVRENHNKIIEQLLYLKELFIPTAPEDHIKCLGFCIDEMTKHIKTQYEYFKVPSSCLMVNELENNIRCLTSCVIIPVFTTVTDRAYKWHI